MEKLQRIIIHHTAGLYTPNLDDMQHYHYLIDYNKVTDTASVLSHKNRPTIHKPEDNLNCTRGTGTYAAHVGGLNTGSIGISACCHLGYSIGHAGEYPLTKKQFELLCSTVAQVCKEYNIPVVPLPFTGDNAGIGTHAEVGIHAQNLIKSGQNPGLLIQDLGKVDILFLEFQPNLQPNEVGDFIRKKIKWYSQKL